MTPQEQERAAIVARLLPGTHCTDFKRCRACGGWGLIAESEAVGRRGWSIVGRKCSECFGLGVTTKPDAKAMDAAGDAKEDEL